MDGARSHARSRVQEVVSAWLAGDYDTVADGCTSDVRWWTPLNGETVSGPADARAELQRVLEPLRRPIEVTAVVPNEDGTRCVVELRSGVPAQDTPPALVTSVITLRDGKISAGRTYVDIKAHDRPSVETA
jgi:ketosteroid isomerase-like protein